MLEYCKKKIQDFIDKNLIRKIHPPWSYVAFYVQNSSKIEINTLKKYKPFNKVLKWIRLNFNYKWFFHKVLMLKPYIIK